MTAQAGSKLRAGDRLPAYTVRAHNAATHSDNKIHEDTVARQYGFRGGLVPGVTVHAYMTRPIAEALGLEWIERGTMSARFVKPLYEGDQCGVEAKVTAVSAAGIDFDVSAVNQDGEICGVGTASLPAAARQAPAVDAVPQAPIPEARPPASESSLAAGTVLGTLAFDFVPEGAYAAFLEEVADDLALYRGEHAVAHPGFLVRWGNAALVQSVVLGPWIHVSSDVEHFSLARFGDHIVSSAMVTDLFERKGHKFVDLDVLMVANGTRPVMRIQHRAIYEVRTSAG
ncbi:MAG: hypothetical protein C0506_10030 [Anaerolinea sp.]|nr:hypothetical protein [Anaerolinea sp.]